jgi:hypothetical protein
MTVLGKKKMSIDRLENEIKKMKEIEENINKKPFYIPEAGICKFVELHTDKNVYVKHKLLVCENINEHFVVPIDFTALEGMNKVRKWYYDQKER